MRASTLPCGTAGSLGLASHSTTSTSSAACPRWGSRVTRASALPGGCPTRSWNAPTPSAVTHPVSLLSGVGSNSQRMMLQGQRERGEDARAGWAGRRRGR